MSATITPLTFTGVSTFSNDFQTILNRAVSIAQIPITQLQNQQTDILQEETLAGNLSAAVADVASSITSLGSLGSGQGLVANSTVPSLVTATVTGNPAAANYSITNITSTASAASETSLASYAGANGLPGSLTLKVGSNSYNLTLSSGQNNVSGLLAAINAIPNSGVTASIVASGPDAGSLSVTAGDGSTPTLIDQATGANIFTASANGNGSLVPGVPSSLTLTIGTKTVPITLASGQQTLQGLVNAINAIPSSGVTASILTTANDQNSLFVSADNTGATTLSLTDNSSGNNLLSQTNQGTDAKFLLNGKQVDRPTNTISDLISGTTLNILGTTAANQTIGINFTSSTGSLSSALQTLVANYNTLAGQVNAQMGSNAGLLSGNSIVYEVRGAMMQLVNYYGGSGSVHGLADLGISMSTTGQMSFDPTQLQSLSASQVADAFNFLGSATAGLGSVASAFSQISDPITGTIKAQQDAWQAADTRLTDQISTMTDQVNSMQTALSAQLQAADSLIASLQSQQNVLTSSIQSLNFSSYGYNNIAPTNQSGTG